MTVRHISLAARRWVGPVAMLISLLASTAAIAMPAPAVTTGGASNITSSSAILHGFVNAHGQIASYSFQYGPTRPYGVQSQLAPAGNSTRTIPVSQAITGLQPDLIYHYRILATGPGGTVRGADRTFMTPKIPLSLQIAGAPNPVVFGNPFIVEGTLSGTGASTREVALQVNPYPYLGGFKTVGTPALTSATGAFSFPFAGLLENTQLRVITVGRPAVSSPVVLEGVAVRIVFHVRRTRRRRWVRLYGTVAPEEAGALIGFQLMRPGRSVNEGGTVVKPGAAGIGRFSRVIRLRHPGLYRALVKISDAAHVSNYSAPILIR